MAIVRGVGIISERPTGVLGAIRTLSAGMVVIALAVLVHCPSARAGFTCSVSPQGAYADGQAQQFAEIIPCAYVVNGTVGGTPANPTISQVYGMTAVSPGNIGILEQGKGNTTIDIGVTQTDTATATIKPFSLLALAMTGSTGTSVTIGSITYDLTSLGLIIDGKSIATVTNRDQATGIYIDEHASASILGTSQSATTEIGPCGGSTLICPGVNKNWALKLDASAFSVGDFLDFSFTLSERVTLNTIAGTATDTVAIDAQDPFEITGMAIVDANGQILPDIIFTDANGFVFPGESLAAPPDTTVPEPTSGWIFGTALVGLFEVRRFTIRRAQA